MKLIPFDPEKDFDSIKDWITDERTHAMWCGNNFVFPLEKSNFIEVFSGFVERCGDIPLLAVSDEGEAEGFFTWALDPGTKECLLKFVVVKPDCRGKGVGREMLCRAVDHVFAVTDAAAVHLNVFQENRRAKKCYENAGFSERSIKNDAFFWRDERWSSCNMIVRRR